MGLVERFVFVCPLNWIDTKVEEDKGDQVIGFY